MKSPTSYRRMRILGEPVPTDWTKPVRAHAIVPPDPEKPGDEVARGWCSPLVDKDTDLTEQNFMIDGSVVLGMRTDTMKVPTEQLRAVVSRRQKEIEAEDSRPMSVGALRDLREISKAMLRKQAPIKTDVKMFAWRQGSKRVFLGTQGQAAELSFQGLFANTFNLALDIDGPAAYARDAGIVDLAPTRELHAGFHGARPDVLSGQEAPLAGENLTMLGREFLTWLIFRAAYVSENTGVEFLEYHANSPNAFTLMIGGSAVLRSSIDQEQIAICAGAGKSLAHSSDVCYGIAGGRSVRELELVFQRGDKMFTANVLAQTLDCKSMKLPSLVTAGDDDPVSTVAEQVMLLHELDDMIIAAYREFLSVRRSELWGYDQVRVMRAWIDAATRGR